MNAQSAAVAADTAGDLATRIAALPWPEMADSLDARGFAVTGPLLAAADCAALSELYDRPETFRSRIDMQRYGFGEGEYQYFAAPLPPAVAALRQGAYPHLAPIANRWARVLGQETVYPDSLDSYLARCHAAGQKRPTPLLLKYGPGDYNRLHQDLYGDLHFPLQMAILLNRPGSDFEGGEFILTEQKPRSQSRAEVVPLGLGEAVIFAVNHRPAQGARGFYRLTMRHGVSRLRRGRRFCLGVIFHDAK